MRLSRVGRRFYELFLIHHDAPSFLLDIAAAVASHRTIVDNRDEVVFVKVVAVSPFEQPANPFHVPKTVKSEDGSWNMKTPLVITLHIAKRLIALLT